MFFDSLGHVGKDFIIVLFIIFTVVLSIYIMILNTSIHWWNDNCKTISNKDKKEEHGPNNTSVIVASVFIGIIVLTILYSIYEYWTKGKIVGLNSYGRRLR